MIKKKVTVSILIFTTLFSGAWIIDQSGKREFYVPGAEEVAEVLPLEVLPLQNISQVDVMETIDTNKVKRFEPREYVRIKAKM
jgi:hypothetical protein